MLCGVINLTSKKCCVFVIPPQRCRAPFIEREGSSLRISTPIPHRENVILSILLPQPSLDLCRPSHVIIRAIYALRRHQLNLEKVLRFRHSAPALPYRSAGGRVCPACGIILQKTWLITMMKGRALHFMKEVARILNTHHLTKAWNSSDGGKFVFIILHFNELFSFFLSLGRPDGFTSILFLFHGAATHVVTT